MLSTPPHRRRRIIWSAALGLFVFLGAAFVAFGGSFLYSEDALRPADAIFVLGGSRMERPLEAADLYLKGLAPAIVLPEEAPDGGQLALEERGIPFPSGAELARDALGRVGVPREAVLIPDGTHNSTAAEAETLHELVLQRGWRRVIVVTSRMHTTRAGFAIRRELKGTDVAIIMRGSRYDGIDPGRWWRTRDGVRFAGSEWQKLIVYWLGLGA